MHTWHVQAANDWIILLHMVILIGYTRAVYRPNIGSGVYTCCAIITICHLASHWPSVFISCECVNIGVCARVLVHLYTVRTGVV